VALRGSDKPHEQRFIEHYARAFGGSGQALLDALMAFAGQAGHPELAAAPFRRANALWALAEEPGAAHVVGRSRELALLFFEDVLQLRQPVSAGTLLQPIAEKSGYLGDRKTQSTWKYGEATSPAYPVSWLPTRRTALAWEALLAGRPFTP
jgi:hypothetical protein